VPAFFAATLLHHVAGNPYRDKPLPPNVVDLARVLLDAGADVGARTLGPNGVDTMGLLVTGKQASDMGVTGPLMNLLLQRGARLDLTRDNALDASLFPMDVGLQEHRRSRAPLRYTPRARGHGPARPALPVSPV
jgi:hypothetical protein